MAATDLLSCPPSPSKSSSTYTTTACTARTISRIADAASWYCSMAIAALILLTLIMRGSHGAVNFKGRAIVGERPCDEIYVVGEGETLHTISDKCGDPYIVERNPHIQDPDDVFPGLVIRITPGFRGDRVQECG